ncbi:hypothetical protein TSOC_004830 [Tetrabaena socialis]|uniref:Right handed beta helix domain-containing protein n=1 Tax=Tetrabaena socialis TaxID=47790 RepID=A0A2J8A7X0_9CHLO|nr:hypothetical protein TSOC_004830 [Tetrabaena socialis]|eukprot:PNH08580.1 hypothetical protein TSOC_004830 [Tetrabaena socialis]
MQLGEGNAAVKGSSSREGTGVSHVQSAQEKSSAGSMTAARTIGSIQASAERQDKTANSRTTKESNTQGSYSGGVKTYWEHYSRQIYLDYLDSELTIDLTLTCKELPKCFNRIRKASLVLGDTLHINSYVEFDDVVVKYNFSGKSVIVVKGGAGTEDMPVTMKKLKATGTTEFSGNKSTGVTVSGPGSTAVLEEGCTLSDNVDHDAVVQDGGRLEATGTTFSGNKRDGVYVHSDGSTAVLKEGCTLSVNEEGCGLVVEDGGHLEATGTTFSGNKSYGVFVGGKDSTAVLKERCKLTENEGHGAVLKATGTMFSGNKKHGVTVSGAGSTAVLEKGCTLSENDMRGASVEDGGCLAATGTTFSGNKKDGVNVSGTGSTAVFNEGCMLSVNEEGCGLVVEDGGHLEATGTTFSGNKKDGVNVSGTGSTAVLKEGCMHHAGAFVGGGGRLEATGTTFSGNKFNGVQVGKDSTAVLTGCTPVGGDGRVWDNGTISAR